ncbi:hypothetical protein VitviT2T_020667 [Vitis vinifera]|uniref:G-type lectin S-receptor-like serine/threonine-protein kinase LECRK3 n=1 Tax=Vitis vinifera TaxID=29760 RepID=A0ABY9D583_VITVI|nr:hypothetical protein VitviT2T_020667 [Vitis vinifera]
MAARFLLLLVLPSLVFSQYCTDLDITASNNSPRCVSPSGEFAFGFYRLGSQSLFLLAIWFEKIPEKTLVWYANGDNPAPKGSKLELTSDGQFILSDPQGKEIWRPQNSVTAVTHAAMLDTGNFVLENRNQNLTVWQSFQNPANTILPTQTLEIGGTMYSQQSNSSYSKGRFQLQMEAGGNLVLNTLDPESGKAYDVYYSSNTNDAANSGNSGQRVIFDESGSIYVLLRNGGTVNIASGSSLTGDYYYRATLDQDGVFRLYNRDNSSTSWSVVKNIPDNICTVTPSNLGSGICGFNSYCSIDGRGLPDCLCPDGYSHLDPLDRKQGCKPNFELPSCQTAVDGWEANKDAVEFRELKDVNWPLSDYQLQEGPEFNKEKCKQSCKDDCLCVVAIYNTDNQCWKKKFPVSNGRHEPTQNVLQYTTALIKVRIKNDTIERCPDKSTLILVGSVLLGSSVLFNLFLLLAIPAAALFFYNKKLMNLRSVSSIFATTSVRTYSYKELDEATCGFKEKLGRGAFGTVYKGVLASDAGRFVAVKKLDKVVQEGEKEFKTEVTVIGRTHHRNLVSLLGYCDQGVHRLLVYEYMNNGSLADLLFGISTPDWSQRLQIAFGIAKGLMFLLLLVLPSLVFSQYCTDLDITASNDSPRCVSPSGEFAFGFYRLGSQSLFLLAIWFEKIPEKTLVWYANGDNPAPKGSKLELTSDGQFILSDPQGKEIWRPQNSVTAVTHAAMLDTGNFVLENRNQNLTVWQSFQNPANTILPTQTLEIGGTMYSQQSNSSYSKGRFQLQMEAGGNLVLNTLDPESGKAYDVYYSSNTNDTANSSNSGQRVIFDESGSIYVLLRNGGTVNIASGSSLTGDYYYRATLDQDGVFRLYNRDNSSTSWSVVKNIPDNICTVTPSNLGSGICGFNSYCSIDGRGMPDCLCPDGYSHLDPLDRKQGCKPNFELPSCQTAVDGWKANKDAVDFSELKGVNWPLSDYQLQKGPEFNKEKCKQSCKDDCLCVVAIYNTNNQCWKKKFPLSNGRHEPTQNVFEYSTALIKVRIKNDTIERCPDKSTLILVGSVLLGSSVFFNLFLLLAIPAAALFFYNKKLMNIQSVSSKFPTTSVRTYSYKELEEATGGFKEKLGRGAFGTVYKGVLASDAGRFVAVKKLDKVVQEGEKEFKTEVTVIGRTHHRNLVSLLGYCDQGVHRLLVYEHMNNGSLADFLFGISTPEWSQRLQIAFGIAKGLIVMIVDMRSLKGIP